MRVISDIKIGDGHTYAVTIDDTGKVVETQCAYRWAMSPSQTGFPWLDEQLQRHVNMVLADD